MHRCSGLLTAFAVFIQFLTTNAEIAPLRRRVLGETPASEPTWFCINRLKAEKKWKHISTPGFPDSLDMKHSRCTWKITAAKKLHIRIAFRGLGLAAEDPEHCSSNYLEIIDETLGKSQGRICGRKAGGDIVSQGNKVRMDLQLDPSEKYQRGFSLSFMATPAKSGFYSKKSFKDPPLPPLKPKPKAPAAKSDAKSSKSEKKSKPETKKQGGIPMIAADGSLVMMPADSSGVSKRQANRPNNKKVITGTQSSSSGEGMSTLTIVGAVVGGLVCLLIIFIILKKCVFNKKKDKEDSATKLNSGLPKINMTHEGAADSKRNILAATVIIPNREEHLPPDQKYSEENKSSCSSSSSESVRRDVPERRLESHAGRRKSKIETISRGGFQEETGIENEVFEEEERFETKRTNSRRVKEDHELRYPVQRNPSKSSPRKIPYRYNSRRPQQDWYGRDTIEALNNEQFADGGTYSRPHRNGQPPRSQSMLHKPVHRVFNKEEDRAPKSRRSVVKQRSSPTKFLLKPIGNGHGLSEESGNSDTSGNGNPRNFKRKKSRTGEVRGRRSFILPGEGGRSAMKNESDMHRSLQNRVRRNNNSRSNEMGNGVRTQSRRADNKFKIQHINGSKRSRNEESKMDIKRIEELDTDYDKVAVTHVGSGRFQPSAPSPNLPRHVVPSSRR